MMVAVLVFRSGSENIDELQSKVREGVSKLRGIDLGDEFGIEILSQLVEGQKSIPEIVDIVYGLQNGDEGYKSSYGRVRREIRLLESKGLVSRSLFGKEKPYRLTELSIINLARIGGEQKRQATVIPRTDMVMYLATAGAAAPVAILVFGWVQLSEASTIGVFGFLCLFLGISLCRFVESVRRVF
jgi:hypothetical protein